MIWLSALLVFGTFAMVQMNLTAAGELQLGFQQLIHARVPWLLLGGVWGGAVLGIAAIVRGRRWWKIGIFALELPIVVLASWYFLSFSFLPPHTLAVDVGDPFPAYALMDQEETLHEIAAGTPRAPALYIFYRGDW